MDNPKSYQVNPEVTFQRLGEETVLVHLGTGRIHHTNATGSRIWELLEEGRSVPEVLEILSSEFEVPADRLQGEVAIFVEKLASEQMIQAADEPH